MLEQQQSRAESTTTTDSLESKYLSQIESKYIQQQQQQQQQQPSGDKQQQQQYLGNIMCRPVHWIMHFLASET